MIILIITLFVTTIAFMRGMIIVIVIAAMVVVATIVILITIVVVTIINVFAIIVVVTLIVANLSDNGFRFPRFARISRKSPVLVRLSRALSFSLTG